MQTRRDQLQAHRFVTRRIVSALLSGEPEAAERPMHRFGLAVFGSTMVAAIVFAGVGVYGFLFPSGAKLADQAIVIERETGARFVYLDGQLHPVLNYASARLVLGSDNPPVLRVSFRSLQDYPRGRAVGIPNLPDPLPDRSAIIDGPWSACSLRRSPGSSDFVTRLVVGGVRSGGQELGDRSLLIGQSTSGGITPWLVFGGRRMRVDAQALAALGLAAARPVPVMNSVIDGIPPGPDLRVPTISGQGETGPRVGGTAGKVGQLYMAAGQHYVLLRSGLATVGPVLRDLMLASNRSVTQISASAAAAARSTSTPAFDPPGFPTRIPDLVFGNSEPAIVCAVASPPTTSSDDAAPAIMLYAQRGDTDTIEPAPSHTGPDGVRLADAVEIPPGRAALVRTLPTPGDTTPNTTTYLVTDQGVKYALPRVDTEKVLAALGYGGLAPTPLPTFLLALLPVGPTLDPVAARQFVGESAPTTKPAPTPTRSTPAPSSSRNGS